MFRHHKERVLMKIHKQRNHLSCFVCDHSRLPLCLFSPRPPVLRLGRPLLSVGLQQRLKYVIGKEK